MSVPVTPTPASIICPECGTRANVDARLIAQRKRVYKILPWIVTGLIIVAIGIATWASRSSMRFPAGPTFDQELAVVAHMSISEMQKIAQGGGDGLLRVSAAGGTRQWRSWIPSEITPVLKVRMQSKAGTVYWYRSFGWPSPWIRVSYEQSYSDLDARAGPVAPVRRTYASSSWYNGLRIETETTHPVSMLHRRMVADGAAVAFSILLTLGVYFCGRRILAPLLRRSRDSHTAAKASVRIARVCALGFVFVMVAMALLPIQPTPETTWRDMSADTTALSMTWTKDEIEAMPPGAATDAEIAKRALSLIAYNGAQGDEIAIFYSAQIPQSAGSSGHIGPSSAPWVGYGTGGNVYRWSGDTFWRARWSIRGVSGYRNLQEPEMLSVNFVGLSPVALAVCLLHFLTGYLTYFILLRSTLKRARKSLCQRCAYPLPAPRAPGVPLS